MTNAVLPSDPELKKAVTVTKHEEINSVLDYLENKVSSWQRMVRIVAVILSWKRSVKELSLIHI